MINKYHCRICKKFLSRNKFYKDNTTKSKLCNLCILCYKNYLKTPNSKYIEYKKGAKKRNKKFSLTKSEFLLFWKKPCYYCNEEIKTIGLDRVDNKKGYLLNNIVSCCKICNILKKWHSIKQLERISMIFLKLKK